MAHLNEFLDTLTGDLGQVLCYRKSHFDGVNNSLFATISTPDSLRQFRSEASTLQEEKPWHEIMQKARFQQNFHDSPVDRRGPPWKFVV